MSPASARGRGSSSCWNRVTVMRPDATASIVPTIVLTMWRMNVSASIQNASTPPGSSSHSARMTSRSKRRW